MNLEKQLERWVSASLINEDQAEKIRQFEKKTPSAGWALWGVSAIGILVLMTGVISLIASNWGDIPQIIKVISYFLLLAFFTFVTIKKGQSEGLIKECLLTSLALLALAGIGLIGQVYNLVSNGYSGIYFWLAIILPITLIAKSRLIQYLWFAGFTTATLIWGFESGSTKTIERNLMIIVSIPYIWIGIGYALDRFGRSYFLSAARVWNWLILMITYTVAGSIIWNFSSNNYLLDHIGNWKIFPIVAIILSLGCILIRKISVGLVSTCALACMILSTALLFICPLILPIEENQIIPCLLFFLAWGGLATYSALNDRRRMYDISAFIIGARFVVVYFEVFGSLAATGIGLIISGAMILGVAYAWYKYRATLANFLKGVA